MGENMKCNVIGLHMFNKDHGRKHEM
jgi:hypothetical protein